MGGNYNRIALQAVKAGIIWSTKNAALRQRTCTRVYVRQRALCCMRPRACTSCAVRVRQNTRRNECGVTAEVAFTAAYDGKVGMKRKATSGGGCRYF